MKLAVKRERRKKPWPPPIGPARGLLKNWPGAKTELQKKVEKGEVKPLASKHKR